MENDYRSKLSKAIKGRVFVFIDAANLERSVQDMWVNAKDIPDNFRASMAENLKYAVDYKKLKEFFSNRCDLKEIKFYSADFKSESHRKFLYFLDKLGLKLETKPLKEYKDHCLDAPHRKANFDVEIAVDATFAKDQYDTFILFSGDCDFEYLAKFLRGQSKIFITFSRAGHIAKELPPASNYYFDIVDFKNDILKIEPKMQKIPPKAGLCS